MKNLWILTLVLTLIISVWFLPSQTLLVNRVQPKSTFEITISGAVVFPKTMTFFEPVTFESLLEYVGGYSHKDILYTPPAYIFSETQTIHIPIPNQSEDQQKEVIKININTASFQQLLTIPYMTETRAAELIIYRRENGFFDSIESLIHVKYIGMATLENLRPYITTT